MKTFSTIVGLLFLLNGCTELINDHVDELIIDTSHLYINDPNADYLSSNFTLSYYSPGFGTKDLNYGAPPFSPSIIGRVQDDTIIILNNIGRYIVSVNGTNSSENWRKIETKTPQSLFVYSQGVLGYTSDRNIILIDKVDGTELSRVNPWNRHIRFIKRLEDENELSRINHLKLDTTYLKKSYDRFLVCFDEDSTDVLYITDADFNIEYIYSGELKYPRSADILGSKLLIADTFNHAVKLIDMKTNVILKEWDEYFPNAVKFKNEYEIYILGEHSNRLYTLNIHSGYREMIFSANVEGLDDPNLTSMDITKLEHAGKLHADPSSSYPYSKASIKYSGIQTLYSPNSIEVRKNSIVISDTDNHRVVEISLDGSQIYREIYGLNNPSATVIF